MRIAGLILIAGILQGCTIHQQVTSVSGKNIKSAAIIKNEKVRDSYLAALEGALRTHGIDPVIAPAGSSCRDYPYAITYTANWAWDLTMYMVYTQISVYENGNEIGSAVYDAGGGNATTRKFINAEEKINELVAELIDGPKNPKAK